MIILKPIVHETIWGGERINKIYPTDCKKVGHLYMVSGHEGMSNEVLNGVHKGQGLDYVFQMNKSKWGMEEYGEFPLTIALVDASENLSIQVHPDDITAQKLEGQKIGKKESWLFLSAPKAGWIFGGCEYSSVKEIEQAVVNKKMELVTAHLDIKAGQYVCVSPGTLHAMTEGSFVYEIEYGSNFTYRFYDYERVDDSGKTRELHVEKALRAIIPDEAPVIRDIRIGEWMHEDVYEIKRCCPVKTYKNNGNELECLSILDGSANDNDFTITAGMSVVLFPGETIGTENVMDMVIARLNR